MFAGVALDFLKSALSPTSQIFYGFARDFGLSRALRVLLVPDYSQTVLTDELLGSVSATTSSQYTRLPAVGSEFVTRSAWSQEVIAAISRGLEGVSIEPPIRLGDSGRRYLKNLHNLMTVRIASALGDDSTVARWIPTCGFKPWWYGELELARILEGGILGASWTRTFQSPYESAGLEPPSAAWKTSTVSGENYLGLECPTNDTKRDIGLISVIITTHNPGPWLSEAIRSIENQTVAVHEILLVDDHSDDRYTDYIDSFSSKNANLRVIRLASNVGTYRSRLEGVRRASGDYLAFQDSDDWSHPERLERQIEAMKHRGHQASIPVCGRFEESMKVALWRQVSPGSENGPGLVATRASFTTSVLKLLGDGRTGVDGRILYELAKQNPGVLKLEIGSDGQSVPLLIQLANRDSLSGSDYLLGWENPSRRRYKDAYRAEWVLTTDNQEKLVGEPIQITFVVGGFTQREQERSARMALSSLSSVENPSRLVNVYWTNPVRTKKNGIGPWTSKLRISKACEEIKSLQVSSSVIFFGVGAALLTRREDFEEIDKSSRIVLVSQESVSHRAVRNTLDLAYRRFAHRLELWSLDESKRRITDIAAAKSPDGQGNPQASIIRSSTTT